MTGPSGHRNQCGFLWHEILYSEEYETASSILF